MEVVFERNECPDCKVDARLMNSIVQEEIAKGKMGKDVVASTITAVYTNIDARRPPLVGARVPSARIFRDICTKCGKEHTFRIEKGHVTIPAMQGMLPVFA